MPESSPAGRDRGGGPAGPSLAAVPEALRPRLCEAQLRGILDNAGEAILTADDSQTVLMANRAAGAMFGCAAEALVGRPLSDLLPARLRERHEALVAAFGVGNGSRAFGQRDDLVGLRCNGEEFPFDAAISKTEVEGQRLYTVILRDLSGPRRAAEDLRSSRELVAATQRLGHIGFVQIDAATRRFVAVNEGFCRLSGYTADELLGRHPDELNHPDDRLDVARFEAMLRGEAEYRQEKRIVRKDGQVIWVEVSGSVLHHADGRPAGMLRVVQDIDARRRAEDALRAREARLDFLVRLNDLLRELDDPEAIAFEASRLLGEFVKATRVGYAEDVGDGEHIVVRRNYVAGVSGIEGRYRYDDYGPALLQAFRAGRTVVHPDIAADARLDDAAKAAHAQLQLAATVNVPLLHAQRLQAVFFVHSATPRAWSADEVSLFEDVAQRIRADITRARAEVRRRAAQARLHAALHAMADAVLITDAHGHFVESNEAFLRLHGFASVADCPRTLAAYLEHFEVTDAAGAPLPLPQWPVSRALRGETGQALECGLRPLQGGKPWIASYSYAPIRDAEGQLAGAVVSARDITETRRIAAELEASHAQLQRMVAARDQVQEEERLRIARELHDELQQSLAAMLIEASAARTPELAPDGPAAAALDRLERSARDTLTATRRIIHDLRPVVLDELGPVPALAALVSEFSRHNGIAGTLDTSALDAADEARIPPALAACLYRLTQEALTNAGRHAAARQVRVTLASEWPAALRLRIADDGRGMPAEPATPRPRAERFGLLGMRERVRAVGGSLGIRATPGGGTTLDIVVPLPPPRPVAAPATPR